jgi:hypothetical protein
MADWETVGVTVIFPLLALNSWLITEKIARVTPSSVIEIFLVVFMV